MTGLLQTFAATQAAQNNMFTSLGIDWKMLIFQAIAFVIFVFVMAKWVMPPLLKAVDKRQADIEASTKAAHEAEENAQKAEAKIAKDLEEARKQAQEMIDIAHKEAAAMVEDAEEKAAKRSDHIIAQAEARLATETTKAREALRQETTELVALATGKILNEKVDAKKDADLIASALHEADGAGKTAKGRAK